MTTAVVIAGFVVTTVLLTGQVMVGAWVSLTLTVKVQVSFLPPSVAVQVTVVVPVAKNDPEAGEQTTVAFVQGLTTGAG